MPYIILMEFRMKWLNNKNLRKWLRIIHRDLGYFFVGITFVYGISGIILNHKEIKKDPAFKTHIVDVQFSKALTISEFKKEFENEYPYTLNKIIPNNTSYQLYLQGGMGNYNTETGLVYFEIYQKKPIVYFINKLHYNQKKYWTAIADIFAGAMIFFALSGLFMVRGKNSILKRGKWYLITGILLVVLYIWL